jgi:UDPglucose 6-dehydrogenase
VSRHDPYVGVIGLGYVGLAYAIAFSLYGFKVFGVDIDSERIRAIKTGLVEDFPREVVSKALEESLVVSEDYDILKDADIVFIAVDTLTNPDASQDLSQILSALKSLAEVWKDLKYSYRVIVFKSTVLPGTTRKLADYAREILRLSVPDRVGIVYNPEFLRSDKALEDVLRPFRVVIGGIDDKSSNYIVELFREFYNRIGLDVPIFVVSPEEAELIKYASNIFLALKILYSNIIGLVCKEIENCDAWKVMEIVGLDPRIGRSHIMPGMPYGGPCLVKDVLAFAHFVEKKTGIKFIRYIHEHNEMLIDRIVEEIEYMLGELQNKKIAVLGIAYKPGSSNIKDSQSIKLIMRLLSKGAEVYIHDVNSEALNKAKNLLKNVNMIYSYEQLKDVDIAIVTVKYNEYIRLAQQPYASTLLIDLTGALEDNDKIYRFYATSVKKVKNIKNLK